MDIVVARDTVTYHGTTYRLGQGGTPLLLAACLPSTLPAAWREIPSPFLQLGVTRDYSRAYVSETGVRVLVSAAIYDDRTRWLLVSVAHRGGRLPTWREMCVVKDAFCGAEMTAYQVHPPRENHGSIHDKVLHLWTCLDGPVTPDFTRGGQTI